MTTTSPRTIAIAPGGRGRLRRSMTVAALATAPALVTAPALAEARWEPGRRTTSPLPNEVRADAVEPSDSDGVYGRFEAPFDLALHAGAEIDGHGAAGAARASLHYFFMAGVYAGYADAFGSDALAGSRILSFGVDVRPAFIPRWSKNMEQGGRFADLTLDSISLGLGAYLRSPRSGSLGDDRGFELSLGFALPLTATAFGPWIGARGLLRWDDPRGSDGAARASALVTLEWHFPVGG